MLNTWYILQNKFEDPLKFWYTWSYDELFYFLEHKIEILYHIFNKYTPSSVEELRETEP